MLQIAPVAHYLAESKEVRQALQMMEERGWIALDTETTGLDLLRDRVVFWSFSDGIERFCAPALTLPALRKFLENSNVNLILHNANFDVHMLSNSGIRLYDLVGPYRVWDSMVMDNLLNPNGRHDLKLLCKDRLGIYHEKFNATFGGPLSIDEEITNKMIDYASLDAWATFHLGVSIMEEIGTIPRVSVIDPLPRAHECGAESSDTLLDYYMHLEQPLQEVLFKMERRGVRVDSDYLDVIGPELASRMDEIELRIVSQIKQMVNLNSPKQLAVLLYDNLGYQVPHKARTAKGAPKTDEATLKILEEQRSGIPGLILEYRKAKKLKSTYVDSLRSKLVNGRIHARFNQQVTATGRLSSSGPNLQNIPARSEEGKRIRKAFVPEEGCVFIVADYSQIELRMLAHLARAESMLVPINAGIDIHSQTASEMFHVPYEDVMEAADTHSPNKQQKQLKLYRAIAKNINFGIVYGLSPVGLMRNMKKEGTVLSLDECKSFIRMYWQKRPDVKRFLDRLVIATEKNGYVPTFLGRRRPISGLDSSNRRTANSMRNETYNTPIQGSAAEVVKWAMLNIDRMGLQDLDAHMLMQVHDELVFEVPEEHTDEAMELIQEGMEHIGIDFLVPLSVGIDSGPSWADCK